jgi:hypothetical protein
MARGETIEFIDCGSLSISYDATGKATISCSIIRNDAAGLQNDYNTWRLGGVFFDGNVMGLNQSPMIGSGGWNQWQLRWEGVGN